MYLKFLSLWWKVLISSYSASSAWKVVAAFQLEGLGITSLPLLSPPKPLQNVFLLNLIYNELTCLCPPMTIFARRNKRNSNILVFQILLFWFFALIIIMFTFWARSERGSLCDYLYLYLQNNFFGNQVPGILVITVCLFIDFCPELCHWQLQGKEKKKRLLN